MSLHAKYGFTGRQKDWRGQQVREIVALRDFGFVNKGDLGGWIESENNLSQAGNCWLGPNCKAKDNSLIEDYGLRADRALGDHYWSVYQSENLFGQKFRFPLNQDAMKALIRPANPQPSNHQQMELDEKPSGSS